jgi:enoyl-CoA hydratase/carnithine racemase
MTDQMRVTVERDGHVLLMGLNRADNRNFFDFAILEQLATAYGRLASLGRMVRQAHVLKGARRP